VHDMLNGIHAAESHTEQAWARAIEARWRASQR
jgi:hypothetical protein